MAEVRIGTAGWSIPRHYADAFPTEGTSLERYSARFSVAEINSSFHRPHRLTTWERWRDSVPEAFRFAAKLPKRITHEKKLVDCSEELDFFGEQVALLGEKLAVLLVQLPPKLEFDARIAAEFFRELAARSSAQVACEPRNASWFTSAADGLLDDLRVGRVAADPAICADAASPGGWTGLSYWRLHGSPAMYRSPYGGRVSGYAKELRAEAGRGSDTWCIFDNTTSSAAMGDALRLCSELSSSA